LRPELPGLSTKAQYALDFDTLQPRGSNKGESLAPAVPSSNDGKSTVTPADNASQGGTSGDVTLTLEDGSVYVGQILQMDASQGKRHGYGKWTAPTEEYEGQWKVGHQDGHGRQTWKDGRVYEGQFQEGKFDGFGRMEWHTQQGSMMFEGQYVNDSKHGRGKFVWPDGRMYDGDWEQGRRGGKALYVTAKGEKRLGIWKDDKLVKWLDGEGDDTGAQQAVP